jgi:probable rRNA maturation factor
MPPYDIELQTEVDLPADSAALIRAAAAATLTAESVDAPASLTILVTDDHALQNLNRDFLGLDEPTDVLSFPAGDPMPGMEPYLGDFAISLPRATAQAETAGHPVTAELQLLTVHGVLHLLGYDHAEPDEKAAMWAAQAGVLAQLGVTLKNNW